MNEEIKNAHWTRLLEFLRTIGWSEGGAEDEVRRCKALYAEGPRDRGDGVEVNIDWPLVLERTAQAGKAGSLEALALLGMNPSLRKYSRPASKSWTVLSYPNGLGVNGAASGSAKKVEIN